MTAEIAIMNKEAVALAADSAVTMVMSSGEKVFTSANKLFALSRKHPVGIMIYGNALFMEVPWETIIKIYRSKIENTKGFETLEEYARSFITFISESKHIFQNDMQIVYFNSIIRSYLKFLKDRIKESVKQMLTQKNEINDKELSKLVSEIIDNQYKIWKNAEASPNTPKDFNKIILSKYNKNLNKAIRDVLEKNTTNKRI